MRAVKKGETLVEVLVALAVFTILCGAVFSCLLGIQRVARRQEEYVRFEMICRDIAYFESQTALKEDYFAGMSVEENGEWVVFYDSDFQVTDAPSTYSLECYVNQEDNLVVSVYNNHSGKTVIDQLIYGGKP